MPLATGGIQTSITTGGTSYIAHVFTTSGNLNVISGGPIEYLIVGAGGGGGSDMGGGGGAGGFLTGNTTVLTGTYTITVGAGGVGAPAGISQVRGSNGADSAIQTGAGSLTNFSNYFDGRGDYLNIPANNAFLFSAGNFTIEAWIFPVRSGISMGIANTWQIGGAWIWELNSNGTITFQYTRAASGISSAVFSTTTAVNANTWTHVAVVRVGNLLYFYFNGVLDSGGAKDISGSPTMFYYDGGAKDLRIGISADLGNPFFGAISNFRIVKGTGLYPTNFTPSTNSLTTTSQGATASQVSILTCQSSTIRDNSSNNFTITVFSDVRSMRFNPFDPLVAVGGGGGASEYSNNNSPASWGGSGGGTAGDVSTTFGVGLAGQGFAGGTSGGTYYPSGGGGAAAAGTGNPGNGGAGRSSGILGITYFWAGGGGGAGYTGIAGNGGIGGGGGGAPKVGAGGFAGGSAYTNTATDGTVGTLVAQTNVPGGNGGTNTGGGGGGGAHYNINNFGGTGGSGMVIVRYIAPAGRGGLGGPHGGGGGGANGYNIAGVGGGGDGANGDTIAAGTAAIDGAGGGGGSSISTPAGGGGGIDIFGQGNNGLGGPAGQPGGGGSANTVLGIVSSGGQSGFSGNGGLYGGGGAGGNLSAVNFSTGWGAGGALAIIYGTNSYPNPAPRLINNAGNVKSENTTTSLTLEKTVFDPDNRYRSSTVTAVSSVLTNFPVIFSTAQFDPVLTTQSYYTSNYTPSMAMANIRTNFDFSDTAVSTVTARRNRVNINSVLSNNPVITVMVQPEFMLVNSNPENLVANANLAFKYDNITMVTQANDPRLATLKVPFVAKGETGIGPVDPQSIFN